jgi:hypothetical protein
MHDPKYYVDTRNILEGILEQKKCINDIERDLMKFWNGYDFEYIKFCDSDLSKVSFDSGCLEIILNLGIRTYGNFGNNKGSIIKKFKQKENGKIMINIDLKERYIKLDEITGKNRRCNNIVIFIDKDVMWVCILDRIYNLVEDFHENVLSLHFEYNMGYRY